MLDIDISSYANGFEELAIKWQITKSAMGKLPSIRLAKTTMVQIELIFHGGSTKLSSHRGLQLLDYLNNLDILDNFGKRGESILVPEAIEF